MTPVVHSAGKRRAFREERQLIEQLRAVTNRILAQGRAAE